MPEMDTPKVKDHDQKPNVEQKKVTDDEKMVKKGDSWFCADPGCKQRNTKTVDTCQQCGMSAKMSKGLQKRRGGGRNFQGGAGAGGRGDRKGTWGGWNRNNMDRRKKQLVIDSEDPVQNMFGQMCHALDYRYDKRERIVKLSRDITIESKRIIFCLHRIKSEQDKDAVLGEAEHRLMDIKAKLWYYMARELKGEDHYQFIKAYSSGLQEWVEALSFYHYLAFGKLISFSQVEQELVFKDRKSKSNKVDQTKQGELEEKELGSEEKQTGIDSGPSNGVKDIKVVINIANATEDEPNVKVKEIDIDGVKDIEVEINIANATEDEPKVKVKEIDISVEEDQDYERENTPAPEKQALPKAHLISVTVPQEEFILGLADLSGELMRNAINSLGSGNLDVCFILLDFLQNMTDGFTSLPKYEAPKDIGKKMFTLKQSCTKVENACYAICVRGSEIPKSHWADIFAQRDDERRQRDEEEGDYGGIICID